MKSISNHPKKYFKTIFININTFIITSLIILCFSYIFNDDPYNQSYSIATADTLYSTSSIIKSDLIAIRSYCNTSEMFLNDASGLISSDPTTAKNRYIYAKYYYSLGLNKIRETEALLNSIPNLLNRKPISDLLTSLSEKQANLQSLSDNMDEITVSLDRRIQPSQNLLDNLRIKSTNITAFLNNIIESYDSSLAPFINE